LYFVSDQTKQSHLNGKAHRQKLELKEKQNRTMKHSVYVRGFDLQLPNLEAKLQTLFEQLGGKVKDVYVDKNSVSMF